MVNENKSSGYGQELVAWEVHEYPKHERSWFWYLATGIIGLAMILYGVFTANFLFALIILMVGIISIMSSFRHPELVDVAVTTNGIIIGTDFYAYKVVKDFSIVYDPPHIKNLYVDFIGVMRPMASLPLEEIDPNEVRKYLLPYVVENLDREDETSSDMVGRLYKL